MHCHWVERRWDEFHSAEDYSDAHRWHEAHFPSGSLADCLDWLPAVLQAFHLGDSQPVHFAGLGAPSGDEYRVGWAGFLHGLHWASQVSREAQSAPWDALRVYLPDEGFVLLFWLKALPAVSRAQLAALRKALEVAAEQPWQRQHGSRSVPEARSRDWQYSLVRPSHSLAWERRQPGCSAAQKRRRVHLR